MTKVILSGDWHAGRDHDSPKHNQYLLDFIAFMVDYANDNGIDEIVQVGDFFDNRTKISNDTLNYGIYGARYINENFQGPFRVLTGNHDLYYKNRLDVSSTKALEHHCILMEQTELVKYGSPNTNILYVPWVTDGEMWDDVVSQVATGEIDYVFGHFEFKKFLMNENYEMEHGLSHKELKRAKRVITGHYHKRQIKDNVIYTGSPFPFDYNDANDLERGFLVLDTETNEVEFVDWDKVKILSLSYDEFLEYDREGLIDEHTSVRIDLPEDADDATIEAATERVSELNTSSSKINYKGNKANELMNSNVEIEEVDNVDQTIVNSIRGIEQVPDDVSLDLLEEIYLTAAKYGDQDED